jgi:hypothetical protein
MRPFSTTALQLLLLLPAMATAFFVPASLAPQYKGACQRATHTGSTRKQKRTDLSMESCEVRAF